MDQDEINREADKLYNLLKIDGSCIKDSDFINKVDEAGPKIISNLIAKLGRTNDLDEHFNTLRDSCIAILQRKLTENLINTSVRLDKSARFLAWVGIVVAILIGAAQIIPLLWK